MRRSEASPGSSSGGSCSACSCCSSCLVVVFAATQALPGDPARSILGRTATPASLKALRDQLGLGGSVLSQYRDWIGGLLHGDAGNSLAAQEPVSDLLGDKVVNSAFLVFCAGLISIPLSIAIGAYAALRRDRTFDVTSSLTTLVFASLPEFVVGISLVVIFATTIFPASCRRSRSSRRARGRGTTWRG